MYPGAHVLTNTRLDSSCFRPLVIHAPDDEASFLALPYVEELMLLSQLADASERQAQGCRAEDLRTQLRGHYGRMYDAMSYHGGPGGGALDQVTAAVVRERIQREALYEELYFDHTNEPTCVPLPDKLGTPAARDYSITEDTKQTRRSSHAKLTSSEAGSAEAHEKTPGNRVGRAQNAVSATSSNAATAVDKSSAHDALDTNAVPTALTAVAVQPSWRFLLRVGLSRAMGLSTPAEHSHDDDGALGRVRVTRSPRSHTPLPLTDTTHPFSSIPTTHTRTAASPARDTGRSVARVTEGYLDLHSEDGRCVVMYEWFEDALTFAGMHAMTAAQTRCILIDAMCLLERMQREDGHAAAAGMEEQRCMLREWGGHWLGQAVRSHTRSAVVEVKQSVVVAALCARGARTGRHSSRDEEPDGASEQSSRVLSLPRQGHARASHVSPPPLPPGKSSAESARRAGRSAALPEEEGSRPRTGDGREDERIDVCYTAQTERCFSAEECARVMHFLASSMLQHGRLWCRMMHRTRRVDGRGGGGGGNACGCPSRATNLRTVYVEDVQPFCIPPLSEFLPQSTHTAQTARDALWLCAEAERRQMYEEDCAYFAEDMVAPMLAQRAALMHDAATAAQANRDNKMNKRDDVARVARAFELRIDRVVCDNVPRTSTSEEQRTTGRALRGIEKARLNPSAHATSAEAETEAEAAMTRVGHFNLDEVGRRVETLEGVLTLPDIQQTSTANRPRSMAKRGTM